MLQRELEELQQISQAVGNPVEYTQGGGGNTSVKLSDQLMAVKASGFKLKQITPTDGYVVVDYQKIKNYFEQVDLTTERDFEKESVEFVKSSVIPQEGVKVLRPSVEAGFHSLLKKYVIHTHPVYANILCCAENGRDLVEEISARKSYGIAWIPYINPGFCLTLKIKEAIKKMEEQSGKFPAVIFMENHGLIVNADDSSECVALHEEVNSTIRDYLEIREDFPRIQLVSLDDNTVISKTSYITGYFKGNHINNSFFDEAVLYPDQLVYLNGSISVNGADKKVNINTHTGEVIFNTNLVEAQTMEETLLAYLYVVNGIKQSRLALKTMSAQEIDFIKNWESEAYRKSLVKETILK